MKKLIILFLILTFIFVPNTLIFAESNDIDGLSITTEMLNSMIEENSNISSGDPIKLSINKAVQILLEDNCNINQAYLDLESAEVSKRSYRDIARKNKSLDYKEGTAAYLSNVTYYELLSENVYSFAERNIDSIKNDEKINLINLYYQIIQQNQSIEIEKESLDLAKELYENVLDKYNMGLATRQELIESELSSKEAEKSYKESILDYNEYLMNLNHKLGLNLASNTVLTDELLYYSFDNRNIEEDIKSALENRNEIKALEFQNKLAQLQFTITSKETTENTYDYQRTLLRKEIAEKNLKDGKDTIKIEIIVNYLEILKKLDEIETNKKSVELAEELLNLNLISYEAGLKTLTDVKDSQLNLTQSKLTLSKSILNFNMTVLEYDYSLGIGTQSQTFPM